MSACAALVLAQPQKQPPQAPPKQGQRDLRLEKIENEGAEPPTPKVTIPMPPRSYALVVGVSRYAKLPSKLQLPYAEADAQLMYTILISPEGGNFKAENVHVLTNEKATLANLRQEINGWLPSVAKEEDRVLIYFAGHGFLDERNGKGFLAPSDLDMAHIRETGLPMEELGQAMGGKIHAKSKILLTDSCHSGALTPEDTEALNHNLVKLQSSLFSLTASRDRERSFEGPDFGGGHGVFTYYVARGMAGAADTTPRDGVVTADELAEYVHTQVREATQGQQNPTSEKGSFDPQMFIALVPANAPPGEPPAPKTGTLIFESNMDDVTVLLDGKTVGVLAKGKTLSMPGLTPGAHTVQGSHNGYEPDGPREETVYPGQTSTVSLKIMIPRHRKQAAVDLVDKGLKAYLKDHNYKAASESFLAAFNMDSTYSQAAYYLARCYASLFDQEKAETYYKKAIQIDPDYSEARTNYAGMLLDKLDTDEAIRQLNAVIQREPKSDVAWRTLAQAYRLKGLYPQSIEAAQKSIQLAPTVGEPHLWLGDSLRLSNREAESETEYEQYLKLTNFDPKLSGQLNYYVLGSLFGFGRRKRAAEKDVWSDLRSLAYFGLCDSEKRLKHYDTAIAFCQKALSYSPDDPFAHYALGLSYAYRANANNNTADLDPAVQHLQKMVEINPDLEESKNATTTIKNIQQAIVAYQKALTEYKSGNRSNL
ncbi:MAG TPA: tetratricopeptide repeat protein [Bryobacteraceae bacterium]|nr:tetratricopeptide repeat protein [Bryobacteraceae bacterium]